MRSTVLAAASLAVLASAACASGGASPTPLPKPTTVSVEAMGGTGPGWGVAAIATDISPDATVTVSTVEGDPDRVLAATQQAYLRLGIPVTLSDPIKHTLGSQRFQPGRRFLNRPMSDFVQCGNDQMGAPIADKYAVTMEIRTALVPLADGRTEVRSTLSGVARDRTGSSDGFVRCGSRGVLEQRIGTTIQLMVSGAVGGQ